MYTFTETDKHAVDEFAVANGIFQQTSYWADFRRIFKPTAFIGSDGQKTVLSCLMLRLMSFLWFCFSHFVFKNFVLVSWLPLIRLQRFR